MCGPERLAFPLISTPVDHLVQARRVRVGTGVDNVDVVRPNTRHQQVFARHRRVAMTGGTGVPAHMMQLIPNPRHLQPMDHLGIGRTFRIRVYRRQIVRFLYPRPRVYRDGIKQLFTWRLDRLRRARISRTATCHLAISTHVVVSVRRNFRLGSQFVLFYCMRQMSVK